MRDRIDRLVAALGEREAARGGRASDAPIEFVRAPGRVNLIGEHTDYNEGLVLPVAIDLEVWVAFRPHEAPAVELTSLDLGSTASFIFEALAPRDGRPLGWIDYVGGMAWALRSDELSVRGFVGVLDSTVPVGAGLSSSAALEMAAAQAFLGSTAATLPPGRLAALGRRVENRYVGVNTGIMDQFASVAGRAGHAMRLDCRSLEVCHVPLPPGLAVIACDTASPRRLEASQYNARRADCDEAVRILSLREPSVRSLRDVDVALLARHRGLLPERIGRRCDHVVSENARVDATVAALEAGELDAVRRLFAASHASLRDLYEVSSPELDTLVEIAMGVPGVVAARMTGGGFGGCTVNLVHEVAVEAFREAVLREYPRRTGLQPKVHVTRAVDGAGPMGVPGA
jgi:galactokinase